MDLSTTFFVLAFTAIAIYIVSSMIMVSQLQKRGVKINFFLLRLYLIKYAQQYKKITKEETGRIGSLYYLHIISVNTALVCAVIGLLLR
ncbi:hypothetical protein JXA02_07810 [candidate division KSB1 bacterium]|nr:hypothetical protein [candidate division KSB1 bacterium]RQW06218.1 MAG: hypothetical protein EH222_09085 [candidate division KSB1 bacterium]